MWTGICGGNSSCKTIPSEVKEELTFDDTPEASEASESFIGLCSMAKEMIGDFPFIYTCQCEQDFGYENCTEVQQDETTIDAGTRISPIRVLWLFVEARYCRTGIC